MGDASLVSSAVSRDALLVGMAPEVRPARVGAALPASAVAPAAAADADAGRRYVLWGALVVAVGVLGAIAWRVAKAGSDTRSRDE